MEPTDDIGKVLQDISKKLDGIGSEKRPIWPHYVGFTLVLVGVFAGCAAYTKAQATESAAAIKRLEADSKARHEMAMAEARGLRRVIAMQREDPKAFPRLEQQFKAIEEYENGKNNRRTPD